VTQRTFSIIKPDAVRKNDTAAILSEIGKASFGIVAIKKESITKREAEGFYAVHRDLRKLMGATNPANAEPGTIRKKFAASIQENAIHGSDAEDTAAFEIGYWFAGYELI
jgi:nucleoside-diphosphate kinase